MGNLINSGVKAVIWSFSRFFISLVISSNDSKLSGFIAFMYFVVFSQCDEITAVTPLSPNPAKKMSEISNSELPGVIAVIPLISFFSSFW